MEFLLSVAIICIGLSPWALYFWVMMETPGRNPPWPERKR